jgi:hypothetical protein
LSFIEYWGFYRQWGQTGTFRGIQGNTGGNTGGNWGIHNNKIKCV